MYLRSHFTVALFIFGVICAQAQHARVVTRVVTDTMPAWKTWKSDVGTINYPGGWTVDASASGDTAVIFRHPLALGAAFPPQVALVVADPEAKVATGVNGTEGQLVAQSEPDASGAYTMEFTATVAGAVLRTMKQVSIQAGRTFILSYTAPQKEYEENLVVAEAMMNSFSFPGGH